MKFLPQHLIILVLFSTEQDTKSVKELKQVLKNPGTKTSFTIGECQIHTINILEKLFNTMQPKKTQTKVVTREVPMIAPPRVPITVPPQRVPATETPPMVMTPRVPMISHEDPIEERRQRDTVENNNQQQLKHIYPTRITKLPQEIN